ncbi:MAG: hypothetical protein HY875_17350 [Chloroflexi bacterium]|nr:hypothetical protein [Chloroflexota bacterium]
MRSGRWWTVTAGLCLAAQLSLVACGKESGHPGPIEGPASRYGILAEDSDSGDKFIVEALSRADIHPGSDFYSISYAEIALIEEYRALGITDAHDITESRGRFAAWGFDSHLRETLDGRDRYARISISLFDTESGAREAFAARAELLPMRVAVTDLRLPGEEAILYEGFKQHPGQFVPGLLFRRDNLVARVEVPASTGDPLDAALEIAFIIDEKATGARAATAPTPAPGRLPTPVAPAPWTGSRGETLPGDVISQWQGPEHCDWQTIVFLQFRGKTYAGDPFGILADHTAGPFDRNARLPSDAKATGYRSGKRQLWTAASDPDAVFISAGGRAERWPRFDGGCA